MREWLLTRVLALVLTLGLAGAAQAQSQDIQATIDAQIDAFQADDVTRAFSYASPNIQDIFQTPERFGQMVQQGYPMVWRPAELRYLELRRVAGNLWQRVMITDAQGGIHLLDYQMIPGENGWQINAVQLLRAQGANA